MSWCYALLLIIYLIFPKTVSAVNISQVYPNPEGEDPEWIELYNPESSSISLANWLIFDQLSSPSLIYTLSGSIEPKSYLMVELDSNQLNNSADGVTLFDESGQEVDSMSYASSTKGLSWVLKEGVWQLDDPKLTVTHTTKPSPSPTPISIDPNSILLTEIMACPSDNQDEWIELFNNSNQEVELNEWQIQDTAQHQVELNTVLPPQTYVVYSWTNQILNNSGDELAIYADNNTLHSQAVFETCQAGLSWQLSNNIWHLDQPSPNKPSLLLSSSPTASPTNSITPVPTLENDSHPASHVTLAPTTLPPQSPHFPLPILPSSTQATLSGVNINSNQHQDNEANQSPLSSLSVIIGGLFFQIAGGVTWYENKLLNRLINH